MAEGADRRGDLIVSILGVESVMSIEVCEKDLGIPHIAIYSENIFRWLETYPSQMGLILPRIFLQSPVK